MTTFDPNHNIIVVQIDKAGDTELPMGLVIPEAAQSFPNTGIAVGVGPYTQADIRKGDRVVFPPHGVGYRFSRDGEDYIVLLDGDILGVIRDE